MEIKARLKQHINRALEQIMAKIFNLDLFSFACCVLFESFISHKICVNWIIKSFYINGGINS